MTLAFALRGSNGLVLGADSRMSSMTGSVDTSTKFLQINREVGVLTYGLSEVGYKAITKLAEEVNKTTDFSVTEVKRVVHFAEIATLADKIFRQSFEAWFKKQSRRNPQLRRDDPRLLTGFIVGGYDLNETNQFKILAWQSPNFERKENPDIIAAQWHISQFLVNHMYYFEMNVEQLKRLAVFMLVETAMISPTVGGPLQIATITAENGFQKLNDKDVQDLINENQYRFALLRKKLMDQFC